MKAWKDKDNKSDNSNETANNSLLLSLRQLSFVVAGNTLLLFTVFILGYFWGQKSAVEQFVDKMYNESFADQISSSLFSLQEKHGLSEELIEPVTLVNSQESAYSEKIEEQEGTMQAQSIDRSIDTTQYPTYYAQLIGFGTFNAANRFITRLQQKNIDLDIKKRISKTARGKKTTWYQVITKKYNDRSVLEKLVKMLKEDEKLKDPCIIVC